MGESFRHVRPLIALASLLLLGDASAQVTLRSDLVVVPVLVRDRSGRPVRGLTREDFEVYDNGRPQEIAFFSTEAEPGFLSRPLALSILLDASGSIAAIAHIHRSAIESLLSWLGPDVLVSLIHFHEAPELLTDFTRDPAQVRRALERHRLLGGETALFDALFFAFGRMAKFPPPFRKLVLLITDGLDTASTLTPEQCLRRAEILGITLYVIATPIYSPVEGHLRPRPLAPGLAELARQTGGRVITAGTLQHALDPRARLDLRPILQEIVEEISSQYYIGYYAPTPSRGGAYHRIRVRVKRKGVRVEVARRGYIARP